MGLGTALLNSIKGQYMTGLGRLLRRCIFNVISVGYIPTHIAFIKGRQPPLREEAEPRPSGGPQGRLFVPRGHAQLLLRIGGQVRDRVYAFSIENFKRKPDEVQSLMDLMLETIDKVLEKDSIVHQYRIRLRFVGNLMLLTNEVRAAAEKAMEATAGNQKAVLLVCIAYTSTDEIAHAVDESCRAKNYDCATKIEGNEDEEMSGRHLIWLSDIEKNMYMALAPDPDRTLWFGVRGDTAQRFPYLADKFTICFTLRQLCGLTSVCGTLYGEC